MDDLVIIVTRLNGPKFAVNPDLLQRIDSAPDTILTLVDGTKYIVEESTSEIIELITQLRAELIARAQNLPLESSVEADRPTLSVVRSEETATETEAGSGAETGSGPDDAPIMLGASTHTFPKRPPVPTESASHSAATGAHGQPESAPHGEPAAANGSDIANPQSEVR